MCLLRCDKTLDDDVVLTVDVTVDRQVARGTVEGVVSQRQCGIYCPTAGGCLARVLFSHSREACRHDLRFKGQTLVKGLVQAHHQVFVHLVVPVHVYQFLAFEWWWHDALEG